MSLPRETFPPRIADLGFSMEMPVGFFKPDLPEDQVDLDNPTVTVPLMVTASPIALALITVTARPAYTDGAVMQWFLYLAAHHGITIDDVRPGRVGGLTKWHPAILARGSQTQDGVDLVMRFAVFEDGSRLVIAHAMCPVELEASYLSTLGECIESIELTDPRGPTAAILPDEGVPTLEVIEHDPSLPAPRDAAEVYQRDLQRRLREAVNTARPLLLVGKDQEAEAIVREADSGIAGAVAIARMYEDVLREVVITSDPRRPRVMSLFRRALHWRQNAYPEPHTGVEADEYERGRAKDRAELVGVLGFDPDE